MGKGERAEMKNTANKASLINALPAASRNLNENSNI